MVNVLSRLHWSSRPHRVRSSLPLDICNFVLDRIRTVPSMKCVVDFFSIKVRLLLYSCRPIPLLESGKSL